MSAGRIDIARVQAALADGWRVEHFDELASTNARVLARLAGDDGHRLVVVAEHQTGGRGRHGSTWHCPRGAGILCTLGWVDDRRALTPGLLSLVVPVALCDGIRAATGVACAIDWPNDLVAGDRKLAGVLIEARAQAERIGYAVGFGINCLQHAGHFPAGLRATATSLDLVSPDAIDRTTVLVAVLRELARWFAAPSWDAAGVRDAWRARALGLGRRVCVVHEGRRYRGNLVDIDPTAAILVQLDEGGRRLFEAANTSLEWQRG